MKHANLMNNYFKPNSMYTEDDFRRRFRMSRHVFERVLHDVHQVNPYFQQKLDRAGGPGFSPHQKVTVALQMMAYDSLANSMDETHEEYLREPNQEDLDWLLRKVEDLGFPAMIGSLDCMHWISKHCPTGCYVMERYYKKQCLNPPSNISDSPSPSNIPSRSQQSEATELDEILANLPADLAHRRRMLD
ncbi:uncharacterized protein [Pyrus communis]|uniref:uncharacterized protein n=1 Tax=Pyrus communis TaxID=23211 RepID=UPI0035C2687C